MEFFIFIIVLTILWLVLEKIINKLLHVETKKISETSGRNVERWGRGIIIVILLSLLPFVFTKDNNVIKWYFIFYLILLLGFQSILEWKYLQNSKQYITTLIYLLLSVIIMYNIELFLKFLAEVL